MYDLIYGCGDSYASGQDLVEELYFPEKPRFNFLQWKEHQRKNVDRAYAWSQKNPQIKIRELEKEKCYIAKLGKMTGVPTINNAVSGYGFQKISMVTLNDLEELKQNYKKILCIISFTGAMRLWFPGDSNHKTNSDTIVLGGFNDFKDKLSMKVIKRYVTYSKYTDWAIQMACSYLGIIKYCELYNIDIGFVGTPLMNKNHLEDFIQNGQKGIVTPFIEYYISTLGGSNINKIIKDPKQKIFTAGGHLPEEYHDQTALDIKERFWN